MVREGCGARGNIILALILLVALFPNLGIEIAATKPRPPPPQQIEFANQNGLNYGSAYWHFDKTITTDEVLHRDFRLFQSSGISLICLNVHWSYLEPAMGSYRTSYLDDVIRVCSVASQYRIGVVVDFHTLMHNNSYTIPSWVSPRSFNTVMHNSTVRQAWLSMLSYSATYLSGVFNIHSWHMMNEPYIGSWAVQCSVDDFIQLWADMKSAIRQGSPLPVSVRFGTSSVAGCFNDDPRIYKLLDYMTITWYESYSSISDFKSLIYRVKSHGKEVMIGEWGYSTNKDDLQYSKFVTYINVFKELGIEWTLAWLWRSDSAQITNPGNLGKGYIICKNEYGEPRQAFYAIAAGNS